MQTVGEVSSLADLREQIREDLQCNGGDWRSPGFRAVAVYRFGRWQAGLRGRSLGLRVVRRLSKTLHRSLFRYVRNHYGIELPHSARIGRRFRIAHAGGIVVHLKAVIGDDCVIRQGVTIGAAADFHREDPPRIGNGVDVGANAMILGSVVVGDGARIGPGALVLRDVPAQATAFADPARMIQAPDSPDAEQQTGDHRGATG